MSKKLKLGDVCQIGDGNHSSNYPKASEMVDAGIPFLRAGNIQDGNVVDRNMKFISPEKHEILKKGHLRKGDLLITNRGEIGKLAIVPKEFHGANLNSQIVWLRPDERLLSSYLYYYLKSPAISSSLYAQQTGTALQQLTIRKIRSIEIFVPSIAEQQRIVAKLDAVFAEIDTLISNIQINKFNLKVFYIKHRNHIYKELYRCEKSQKLKEVVDLSRGHNPPKSQFINIPKEGYVRFYQIRDATSDKYATYVPESQKLKKVSKNDFLINAYRHIGEVFTGVEGAFNVALCKLSIKDIKTLDKDFLYFMIPSYLIKGRLLEISERSLIPSMSVKELAEIDIPIPELEKQIEVSSRLKKIEHIKNEVVAIIDQKHLHLIDLKSSFISSYMEVSY